MRIGVCVATVGDREWLKLSRRAVRSIPSGVDKVVLHLDDEPLAVARNEAARMVEADYLIFLDADDELRDGYVDAMKEALRANPGRHLFTPAVQFVNLVGRLESDPFFFPEVPLTGGNWMVIGTMVPKKTFLEVGGFDRRWPIYEDWCLWARCVQAGCTPVKVPDAVYTAHRSRGSRNSSMARFNRVYWHQRIGASVFPEIYEQTTEQEDRVETLLDPRGRRSVALRWTL